MLLPPKKASVSLDLDDKWSYMKTRGDARWSDFPSYLNIVVPRVLQFLDERRLRITFFIVGQDAALPHNSDVLHSIAHAGHEVGNHSFHHEPWLHLYSRSQLETELLRAEEHIERVTGSRPIGFRGPGFSVSPTVLDVLSERGYQYDASTLPTFLGPMARAYYLLTTKLDAAEREKRNQLFGRWRDGFLPLTPHYLDGAHKAMMEVPVTTIPIVRIPFHLSYLVYLLSFSEKLAHLYLRIALGLCAMTGTAPSFLLHPLDFLGAGEAPELDFFPGMQLPLQKKLDLADFALRTMRQRWELTTMKEHVLSAQSSLCLPSHLQQA